jgi:hypothetical protein
VATSPLHSARRKLERAAEFLDEIGDDYKTETAASEPFTVENPSEIEIHPITGRTWHIVRLQVEPPPPKERWGLIAGDAMDNTRAALDHLACRLVEHNNRNVSIRTAFPIWESPPAHKTERKRFKAAIAGMSDAHKDSIRKLQPYANPGTPEAAKLIALATLDNLDKHQILVPINATIGGENAKPPVVHSDLAAEFDYEWNGGQFATKGVELFRVSPRGPVGTVHAFEFPVPLRTTFGDPSTGLRELREIRAYIVAIVESFGVELG